MSDLKRDPLTSPVPRIVCVHFHSTSPPQPPQPLVRSSLAYSSATEL
eukprot:CAMPEP_0179932058 /NCGR_PEP_ID=MMETSP0983-20121128/11042_1 /TAXON_ID=483367 /ORGANISM="non described non described, Strain CCMP 2436" /LENGTH=46 /DNA_ID= /DNA_START= /DNA_END= /DNA_ORIENTATION=